MKPNSHGDRVIQAEKRDTLRATYTVNDPSVSERAMLDLAVHLSTSAGDRVIDARINRGTS